VTSARREMADQDRITLARVISLPPFSMRR
jgi:hypothetical protein